MALASDLDLNGPARELAVPVIPILEGRLCVAGAACRSRSHWVGSRRSHVGERGGSAHGGHDLSVHSLDDGVPPTTFSPPTRRYSSVLRPTRPSPWESPCSWWRSSPRPGGGASFAAGLLGAVTTEPGDCSPRRRRNLAALFVTFVVMVLALRFVGIAAFGGVPIPPSTIVIPFTGYFEVWRLLPAGSSLVTGIPLIAAVATIYVGLTKKTGGVRVSWVATGLLVLMFGPFVLEHPVNWIRAAAALPVLWSLPAAPGRGVVARSRIRPTLEASPRDCLRLLPAVHAVRSCRQPGPQRPATVGGRLGRHPAVNVFLIHAAPAQSFHSNVPDLHRPVTRTQPFTHEVGQERHLYYHDLWRCDLPMMSAIRFRMAAWVKLFESLELCRVTKHDVGQTSTVDHAVDHDRWPSLGHPIESFASRSSTWWPISSASITSAPRARNNSPTELFPAPIPPVSNTRTCLSDTR